MHDILDQEAISLHVVGNDGIPLNAACKIGYEDGRFGFILESWGPKDRNREYNQALDLVIERLINIGVTKLKAYIASADLRENLPDIEGRKLHKDEFVHFDSRAAQEIRLEIGRLQAFFDKLGKREIPKGNRTKRILLTVEGFNDNDAWISIVMNMTQDVYAPTFDEHELIVNTNKIYNLSFPAPIGDIVPKQKNVQRVVYARSPQVRAWVLNNSHGICELCRQPAPFEMEGDIPFLEVHHIVPLYDGGSDTLENCAALCPNCHRAIHLSKESHSLRDKLLNTKLKISAHNKSKHML
ncbi:HNH endonuclease [Enterobacter asburiae]|uniref:HNH endonuclease n=1 Tax=Enterobacter asburiae TaxID=61645 RepID=UPI0018816FA1|nr:HNH endonuclease signature motif containing protein [Enterobacter asburiae]QOV77382.1 HNH endonuclease [Enterobacter asburiae]